MYFTADSDFNVRAFKGLGNACREYLLEDGYRVPRGTDPVPHGMELFNKLGVRILNISDMLKLIADNPQGASNLASRFGEAVSKYYTQASK